MKRIITLLIFFTLLVNASFAQLSVSITDWGNATCMNGSDGFALAEATGGETPYSFVWSNGSTANPINNLSQGTYTVTVTDMLSNFSFTSITISEVNSSFSVNALANDISCFDACDGSVSAEVSGGTSPFTYSWNDGSTFPALFPLCNSGSYVVTVTDANGCTTSDNTPLLEPSLLIVNATSVGTSCASACDGTATASVGGGTAPYTCYWNDVFSQDTFTAGWLCSGSYEVFVDDANGCSTSDVVTVTEATTLTITIDATNAACGLCNGSVGTDIFGGATPYTYLWSDGSTDYTASGLCADTYSITVTDNNLCSAVESVVINALLDLPLTVTTYSDTCSQCKGEINILVSGGASPFDYHWGNGNITNDATNNETQGGFCAGFYYLEVIDNDGCVAVDSVLISSVGISDVEFNTSPEHCWQSDGSVEVLLTGGVTPYSYSWANGNSTSSLTGLSAGNYEVTISDSDFCMITTSVEIPHADSPTITLLSMSDATCYNSSDGFINFNVTGGTPPYQFTWKDDTGVNILNGYGSIDGLDGNQTYAFEASDAAGCISIVTQYISQPAQPVGFTTVTPSCFGESTGSIEFSSGGGNLYEWSNGQSSSDLIGISSGVYTLTITDVNNNCKYPVYFTVTEYTPIYVSASTTAANCLACDGTVALALSGGLSPFTYNWGNGEVSSTATALCAGSNLLTITDSNGCVKDTSIIVGSVSGLSATLNATNVTCNGWANGTAEVFPTGGLEPYFFVWSDGQTSMIANQLSAGVYYVTVVDANSCEFSLNAAISEPEVLNFSLSSTFDCTNAIGTVDINPTGGVMPYVFSSDSGSTWGSFSSIDSLGEGLYYVAVRDANLCEMYDSVVVVSTQLSFSSEVYQPNYCGNYGFLKSTATGGDAPYLYYISPEATYQYYYNSSVMYYLTPGNYELSVSDNTGCIKTVNYTINNLCKPNFLKGKVYDDISANCNYDSGERVFSQKKIVVTPGPYYAITNSLGEYSINLDSGNYNLAIVNDEIWREPLCVAGGSYNLSLGNNDTIIDGLDFALQTTVWCSELEVNMTTGLGTRPCFSHYKIVSYKNSGSDTAHNAFVEVTLPPEVNVISASSDFTWLNQAPYNSTLPDSQNGNTYTYQIGDVLPNTTGKFYILCFVECGTALGKTLCSTVQISPENSCVPIDSTWDKSSIKVQGECNNDSLACFVIYNTGLASEGDMTGVSEYRIYENNVLVVHENFQINGGDGRAVCYAALGNTIRLEADQRPGHPGNSHPNDVVELCGNPNQVIGLVLSMPLDNKDKQKKEVCSVTTASIDPNDKQVIPAGITDEFHFIDSTATLHYKIRFQNTGTDTAFNVFIIDTISPALDPLSIRSGIGSHAYDFSYLENNVVRWHFPWIFLPDSNVNEVASHGFIEFTIQQRVGNSKGTLIENRGNIYFDFNEPVITNTAFNTVGIPDTFSTILYSPLLFDNSIEIRVFPNPFDDYTQFEIGGLKKNESSTLRIFDLTGKQLFETKGNSKIRLNKGSMSTGVYFYSVSNEAGELGRGKIVVL